MPPGSGSKEPPRAVRPKDAATLILVRQDGDKPLVLMGQRHGDHSFMPNKFVFPGGRVDQTDSRVLPLSDLRPEITAKLIKGCSPTRARALAMAAIRETFEETGLLVGRRTSDTPRIRSGSWAAFVSRGVTPALDILDLVARAITPPASHMRFDTRFFLADAEHIQGSLQEEFSGSGELLEVQWVSLSRAQALDLPGITRFVISQVQKRLELPAAQEQRFPVPFLRFRRGRAILEYL